MEKSNIRFGQQVKLDKNDKKILEVLQKEARLPLNQIAKKVRMPVDSVKYRVHRLEKLGVIRFYHAVINFPLLGNPMYTYAALTLLALSEKDEKEFINYLVSQPKITWVCKTSGRWDFIIGICSRDFKEFDEILRKIRLKFNKFIKDYETGSTIEEYKWDTMYDIIEV